MSTAGDCAAAGAHEVPPGQLSGPPQDVRNPPKGGQSQSVARELPQLPPLPPGRGQEAARIVRHACDMLALPTRVACTALTFLHRVDAEELPAERMAAACVFLGAKVEEASVRTNDMLNAVAAWQLAAACGGAGSSGAGNGCIAGNDAGDAGQAATGDGAAAAATASEPAAETAAPADFAAMSAPAAAAAAAFPCLVGDAYATAKRQLIHDEQLLLRRLRFDLGAGADQPHRHLYVLARCWGVPRPAVRAATCLLNDAVAHCPGYGGPELPPPTAAAAALYIGSQLAGHAVTPAGWWRALAVSDAELAAACGTLLDLVGAEQAA